MTTKNFQKGVPFIESASVIRQKGESEDVCVSRGKKCSFFGKFGMLCFLVTFVLEFALLPYQQQVFLGTKALI